MVFEERVTSVFSMVLTTNVDSIDDAVGEDACGTCVWVKVVVEIVVDDTVDVALSDEDPHITLIFPLYPPENKRIFKSET